MKLLPLAVAAILLAGCVSILGPDDEDDFRVPLVCDHEHRKIPCAAGAEIGVSYRCVSYTVWGFDDGHYWVPRPRVDKPSNWAAIESGTIVLKSQHVAVFEADEGGGASFAPAPNAFRPETCL